MHLSVDRSLSCPGRVQLASRRVFRLLRHFCHTATQQKCPVCIWQRPVYDCLGPRGGKAARRDSCRKAKHKRAIAQPSASRRCVVVITTCDTLPIIHCSVSQNRLRGNFVDARTCFSASVVVLFADSVLRGFVCTVCQVDDRLS